MNIYFVLDIVTMTNKKRIKTIIVSPITSTHQSFLFQPGYRALFWVVIMGDGAWACDGAVLGGIWLRHFWEDLPCFDK